MRDSNRRYASRLDYWGRGLVSNPTLCGLMGEQAACLYLSSRLRLTLDVDRRDCPAGDGGCDLLILGARVQVKCRQRRSGDVLVRRLTEGGRLLPLRWHYLVIATWEPSDRRSAQVVTLDGWALRQDIVAGRYEVARVGHHRNLRIADRNLEPMSRLADYLSGRAAC